MAETLRNIQAQINGAANEYINPQIAAEFSTTSAYAVGAFCTYQGQTYRFTTAKTAGAWDSTKVTAVNVADDVFTNTSFTLMHRGTISSTSSSPDDYTQIGAWYINQAVATAWKNSYGFPFQTASRLAIVGGNGSSAGAVFQVTWTGSAHIYLRTHAVTSGGAWTSWRAIAELSDVDAVSTNLTALITDLENRLFETAVFDWSTIGSTSFPTGFQPGYYASSNGGMYTSQKYMRTISKINFQAEHIRIVPPSGYGVSAVEYDETGDYVQAFGSTNTANTVAEFDVVNGHRYGISLGYFSDSSAGTKAADASFCNSIVCNMTVYKYAPEIDDTPDETFDFGMFQTFGVCGGSYDCGYSYTKAGTVPSSPNTAYAWPNLVAKDVGNTAKLYASPGCSIPQWYGEKAADCFDKFTEDTALNLYITTFGANDSEDLGTIADCVAYDADPSATPTTFYGWYAKILHDIRTKAPDAIIIMCTPASEGVIGAWIDKIAAITEIAEHYGLPMLRWTNDVFMKDNLIKYTSVTSSNRPHPTPVGYALMANAFKRLFGECVQSYQSVFNGFR